MDGASNRGNAVCARGVLERPDCGRKVWCSFVLAALVIAEVPASESVSQDEMAPEEMQALTCVSVTREDAPQMVRMGTLAILLMGACTFSWRCVQARSRFLPRVVNAHASRFL